MANTISGQIYYISPVQDIQTKSGSTIQKREVWLTPMYFDRYSGQPTLEDSAKSIKVEFGSERVSQLDSFNVGDQVTISFELRGYVYQKDGYDNCITSVEGRSIYGVRNAQPTQEAQQPQQQAQQPTYAQRQPAYENAQQQPLYGNQQQLF